MAAAALGQLSEVANGTLTGRYADETLTESVEAVQELKLGGGWASLEGEGVSAVALTRALGDILKQEAGLRARAASIYTGLLALPDAPVGTLCEPYAFAAFVQCLKGICLPTKGAAQQQGDGATQQDEAPAESASPLGLLHNLGAFLQHHSMRSSPEMFSMLLDALVDMTGSAVADSSAAPGKKGKRGTTAAGGATVAEVAFSLLPITMDPRHGDVAMTVAMVVHRMVPALLGVDPGAGGKKGAHGVDRRGSALSLITNLLSTHAAARPCLLALMRQLCVRVPDKADCRQMSIASVLALVPSCNATEVRALCVFLYRLSRTQKIGSRMIAVELAGALLAALPSPFAFDGPYKCMLDGSSGAGDELDAPWSALCLSVLVARCNDKSASVRGKSMGCLADVAQSCAAQLTNAVEGGQASAMAGFLPALCASRSIRVQVAAPRGRKAGEGGAEEAGGAEEEEDEEDEDAAMAEAQAAAEGEGRPAPPPREPKVSAVIPARVSQDLAWLKALCHARCRDEKAAVRKSALQLLEAALELCAAAGVAAGRAVEGPTPTDVNVLEEATADALVSVRKAALGVVCSLVRAYPQHAGLAGVWARCVLPMIRDPESAVQDAVLDRLTALVLDPAAAVAAKGRGGAAAASAAAAEVRARLAALAQMGRAASSCLGKGLTMLAAKKQLKGPHIAAGLEAFLSAPASDEDGAEAGADGAATGAPGGGRGAAKERQRLERERRLRVRDQREGAWMVLVEVAACDPTAPSWPFLQRCWDELQAGGGAAAGGGGGAAAAAAGQEGAMLLWVISHAATSPKFPAGDAADLAAGLLQASGGWSRDPATLSFGLPCAAVAAHLAALHRLTQAAGAQARVGAPVQWSGRLYEAAEEVLGQAMEARGAMAPALASRCQLALFTLGEVALLREAKVPGGAAVKAQALTAAAARPAAGSSRESQASASAVAAHAWTCLGKLCMVDEGLAKKCVPLLVQEMSGSPSPVVRTNLLVALSDMVVQFTGLADAYVGRLAAMVVDPHELVRRQALALLANLLLRDYVKWRGGLVHRFLLALVDEFPGVRALAQYLLSDSLATKAPMLAYNHFIEALFVLNDCSAGVNARSRGGAGGGDLAAELALAGAGGAEGGAFHLKGSTPIMRAKRDIIYTALLRRMSPEHRFAASAKLVAEILGGVVDGLLPLPAADEVLGDALRLLSCKDIKVQPHRFGAGSAEEDGGMEAAGGTQEEATRARGKLVGAMMRKHLAESVVPLMVELRYMLQAQKHPLLGSLMLCMASLLRDYKSEVEDILVADKQLAREILHDLKHYEALQKQQQTQQEAAMAAALAPAAGQAPPPPAQQQQQRAAADGAGPSGAAAQGSMPPPPPPGDRRRRQTAVLTGVEPSRTPVAAEVLATASALKGRRPPSRNATPGGGATPAAARRSDAAAAAAAEAVAAGAKTPMAALLGAGPMRTPRTGLLGSAQRGLGGLGGGAPLPSPAPLSARARAQGRHILQQHQAATGAGGPTHMASPALAAALARTGAAATSAAGGAGGDEDPITVVIPNPIEAEGQGQQQKQRRGRPPLGPHNAAAGAGEAGGAAGEKLPHRTPPAELAAAVRAARRAAAEAAGQEAEEELGDAEGKAGAHQGAQAMEQEAAAEEEQPKRAQRGGGRATRGSTRVKAEALEEGPVGATGVAVKKEEAAAGGVTGVARGRGAGKRRHV
ncbi:hypothetical protein HYH03_013090 [Edaphochlamys debaryana]|uniref:Condensin complex subunit 1 C-terminal domain-containing protein n=1 Tax=Edaphochlamys debaryana TaxID=47281 RepID=A0A835XUA7_9CHLO|nr:hypothetical protein HYH03_013090 [Edaphochlamys debaryana]|eukprot:KAG2488406.1 hypothetical protein HYH03_013090 [Edaphochlamys debaryana]